MPRLAIGSDNASPSYIVPPDGSEALFLLMKNTGTSTLYLAGRADVTNGEPAGNDDAEEDADLLERQGFPLESGESISFAESELDLNRRFYLVSATEGDGVLNYEYGI